MHISNPYDMKGVADIICVLPEGKVAFVEVKTKTGKQSADQVLFQKRVEALGAVYLVARCPQDVDCIT
jgi:Holliday junction resolvase-like predicted endonuclease